MREVQSSYRIFDVKHQVFAPCYKDCLTCSNKEENSTYMNCLSCESPYKLFKKYKNCLNCRNYVNYLQTGCIDEIPEGYYLLNRDLRTIDKCHYLCKTCKKGSEVLNNQLHMNCESCKFEDNTKNLIEGNCPEKSGGYNEDSKDDDKDKANTDKNFNKKSNNSALKWLLIISVICIFITAGIIIYVKCCANKNKLIKDGKNIPFEDEDDFVVN